MASATATAAAAREHSEEVRRERHAYQIHMGGALDGTNTRDPVGYSAYGQTWEANLWTRLENLGDELVENAWIVVNQRRDWRSIDTILDEILTENMSQAEKARAIWEFARRHRYHFTSADDEVKDTVKMLNCYGYTLCWDEAYTVANLWQAAGLRIRRGTPHGHCTTEVYFEGAFHLLDSDEHLLVLERDNETIAGEAAIARDHDLMKRAHAYGILSPENRATSEKAAALFMHEGPRSGRGRPFIGGHRMVLNLRPGEALVWAWEDRDKYHGLNKRPPLLHNGRLQYTPRLDENFARWAAAAINLKSTAGALKASDEKLESLLCYQLQSPYVIVGGRLELLLAAGDAAVELCRDGDDWSALATVAAGAHTLCLDACFPADGKACYAFHIRLRGRGLKLATLSCEADIQLAPLSLPALEVGTNHILYTDDSPGQRRVRITHAWRERDGTPPPPPLPLLPAPGARVEGTQCKFAWEEVPGATDYHFELSAFADMRYPLSPTFEKLSSRTPAAGQPTWIVPEPGLLNPGQTYYWRVRARGKEGLWGDWSPVSHLVPQAPGTPGELRLETDWDRRCINLHWQPARRGRAPRFYEIYGSDERSFSARAQPYDAVVGTASATLPANLLATTPSTSLQVVGNAISRAQGNRCYYRVVAVDEAGMRSGPSDWVGTPRPFIYSEPPTCISAGATIDYPVETLCASGELRAISNGTRRYLTTVRDADELRFLLDEGPPWIALDEKTGVLRCTPQSRDAGTHTVTLRVHNGQGGVDVQGFDLQVINS